MKWVQERIISMDDATLAAARKVTELEQILEQQYPSRVNELCNLLNETNEHIQQALTYTGEQSRDDKYMLINKLLMFHRVIQSIHLNEDK
jgi:hypothetical protein